MERTEDDFKLFPLGVKLALIIGFIVLLSLSAVTFLTSFFISKDVKITAEENNLTINSRSASSVQNELTYIRSNVLQLLDLINVSSGGKTSAMAKQAEAFFFERNQEIAEIIVFTQYKTSANLVIHNRLRNNRFFSSNEIDFNTTDAFLAENKDYLLRSCAGETIALNASPFFKNEIMALLLPYREGGLEQSLLILFNLESISSILGTGTVNSSFMINDSADLLCHSESSRIIAGQNVKNHPLISKMRETNQNNAETRQIVFNEKDENGKKLNTSAPIKKSELQISQ